MTPDALAEWLTAVPLFHNVSHAERSKIAKIVQPRHTVRGGFFFHQGDAADSLYILEHGQVRMTQLTPEGEQVILRFIRPRDMFGGASRRSPSRPILPPHRRRKILGRSAGTLPRCEI